MPRPVKSASPLSVRLTPAERADLLSRAGGQTLSAYVKQALFNRSKPAQRGSGMTLADRTLLSHLLATLGGSHLAPNLERLANDAKVGNLVCDEHTTRRLIQACDDVRLMHDALMKGLGVPAPREVRQEAKLAQLFDALNDSWGKPE